MPHIKDVAYVARLKNLVPLKKVSFQQLEILKSEIL